jgi:PIN domain nuclease of toxin-antitoxin system
MDRMLIASALGNDMTIVTNDRIIAGYGVQTIW